MNYTLSAAVLAAVLSLSGCAASLVYDRDRPRDDCRDNRQRCLQSGPPADFSSGYPAGSGTAS